MNVHKNAPPDAARSRENWLSRVIDGANRRPWRWPLPWACAPSRPCASGLKRYQPGRPCRPGGSFVTAAPPSPNSPRQHSQSPSGSSELRRRHATGAQIAAEVGLFESHCLPRPATARAQSLEGARASCPCRRYQREHPGELIHLDIKKLGRIDGIGHRITGDRSGQSRERGIGWEFLHVCIDDASRLAFTEILPDEKKESAVAFLEGDRLVRQPRRHRRSG